MQSRGTEDTTAAFSYLFHSTIQSPSLRKPASPLSPVFLPHPSARTAYCHEVIPTGTSSPRSIIKDNGQP